MSTLLYAANPANDDQVLSDWRVIRSPSEPEWLQRARRRGHAAFLDSGLPTRKHKDWKYTDLSALKGIDFSPEALRIPIRADQLPTALPAGAKVARLVFVNGAFDPDLSVLGQTAGVRLAPVSTALEDDVHCVRDRLGHPTAVDGGPMVALNAALFRDGAAVTVDADAVCEWIELIFVTGGGASPMIASPRNFIVLGPGSRLGVIEHHISVSGERYVANNVTDILIGRSASLSHYRLASADSHAVDITASRVEVGDGGSYENFNLVLSGGLCRFETNVRLTGDGSRASLAGAYIVRGEDHCDNTILVEHLAPRTVSSQVFKGVIDDKGRGVFQGRVMVDRTARFADARQMSKALLLSNDAEIDQQPALEIFADEVKCSHGAACGHLDPDALFYLRARGVPDDRARRILIEGFLGEAVAEIPFAPLREAFAKRLAQQLIRREP